MKFIRPAEIKGEISAPPSKSMIVRAIAASVLSEGITTILNPSFCKDGYAAIGIAEDLGADLNKSTRKIDVSSSGIFKTIPDSNTLECMESGLCIRMFAPIAALRSDRITLGASGSLLKRNVQMLGDLSQLGAKIRTTDGKPPVEIQGPIRGGKMRIDGSETSQFLTGLLMALPLCKEDSVIHVSNLKSRQYVEMTISMLKQFGIQIVNRNFEEFEIKGGQKYERGIVYALEGDWSGAAFLLVAGAVAGKVTVRGLDPASPQPDRAIVDALRSAGAKVEMPRSGSHVSVEKGRLVAFKFDATDCPDLFPPLVALAANCDGTTVLGGANRLKGKESDRADALIIEFAKLGIKITVDGDVMRITGGKIKGGEIDSHGDHRIVMAGAIAALNADKGVTINRPQDIEKSYPGFFDDLERLMK